MYAKNKEKEAMWDKITRFVNNVNNSKIVNIHKSAQSLAKAADSKQEYIEIPRSEKPTYAGEEREKGLITGGEVDASPTTPTDTGKKRENAINSLLQKISAVIAPAIMQRMEDAKARAEGRMAQKLPINLGVKRYPVATPSIPLPMGMQPPAAQAQQPQQSQSPTSAPPVGKGGSPQANPIQSFGAISSKGDLNGNAAFGTRHSTLSPKVASAIHKWAGTPAWQRSAGKNDAGGLNAKGRASYNRATGGNLKAPVTEKNPSGSRAKRQNSFCSRMCGMKKHETGSKTKKDPDSRINKALRKWNCRCS